MMINIIIIIIIFGIVFHYKLSNAGENVNKKTCAGPWPQAIFVFVWFWQQRHVTQTLYYRPPAAN